MVIYGARGLKSRGQARSLLALAAEEHWGLSVLPEMARHERGKPFFPGRADLQFNLSHSGDLALCALDGAPVGVDIQIVKDWRPGLPRRVCSAAELAWLEEQPELWPAFTLLWTLKEARANIRVPRPAGGAALFEGLWFKTWTGPGWAAAVCGHSRPPEKIFEKSLDIPPV